MKNKLMAIIALSCMLLSFRNKIENNLTNYVNPFVGTDGPGNTYPGAVLPFGMVQLSPDNGLPGWDRIAGYFWQDSTIAGFSHTHLTGTGAGDMYDILLMPYNSRFTKSLTPEGRFRPYSMFSHKQEQAKPGYYQVNLLSSGINAELTSTERVGMHRYSFPPDTASKILIDLGYHLNWDHPVDTKIIIENNYVISGWRKSTGWAKNQEVYFTITFSKPFTDYKLYENGKIKSSNKAQGKLTKVDLHFKNTKQETVMVKVSLSSVSTEGAKKNLKAELPHWDFDKVIELADKKWNNVLSKILVNGTEEQKELFYTNLYHTYLTPSLLSDVDGQYKGADRKIHHNTEAMRYDTFSLWDTYRATHPLYTLLCPEKVEEFISSFLGHYDEIGRLPVWSMAGNETNMMIGYHAVPVIVDAYFKGLKMNKEKALEACVQSANVNEREIDKYKKFGYVPSMTVKDQENWSVSKTLEYAFDDWCIAQFAKAMGKTDIYKDFSKRSNNWRNLYDKQSTFFRAKDEKGNFIEPFTAKEYTTDYCESNAWQYFWSVQHDIPGLINELGKGSFTAKLDSMFTYSPLPEDKLPIFSTGMIGQYAHGNEPSHHVAYLYNYVDKPEKTNKLVRKIINTQYNTSPNGYCGNEDCGQMSAWLVFSAMGLYPVNPANGVYDITSPWLKGATINLPSGKTFKITTKNQSPDNDLVKKILLNGKLYNKKTITHQQILKGGELHFILGK